MTRLPLAAYNVSGEYAMVKAAVGRGCARRARDRARDADRDPPRRRRHRSSPTTPRTPPDGSRRSLTRHAEDSRSRKDGAAVALDDLDRRLLNLMQGSFPIEPRPYAAVARAARRRGGGGAGARPAPARRADHPPGHADLRHARARLRLDARRGEGRPRAPLARAAQIINSHPGVSHNYLRNHEFNMWFTIAVERDSRLGLDGTLDVLARADAGAESIRQLPTLKLFKIRMDLEMEGDTEALASPGERGEPPRRSRRSLRRARRRRDPRDAGRHAGRRPSPTRPPPRALGMGADALLEHMSGHARARPAAPRRRDPLPPPRRLLRQRHGRLEGAGGADRGARPADGVLPRHLALLPAPDLRGLALLGLHDGARPLARRSATRCSTRSPQDTGIDERATLYSSTEFKKIRLLYFTDEFRDWEAAHA